MSDKTRTTMYTLAAFVVALALTLLAGYFLVGTSSDDDYPEGISAETAVKKLANDTVTPADISPQDFDTVANAVCAKSSELVDRGPDDAGTTYTDIVDAARAAIDDNAIDVRSDDPESVAGTLAGLAVTLKCPQYMTVPLV